MKVVLQPCGTYHRPSFKCDACAALPAVPERRTTDRRQKERRQTGRKPERAK